MEDAGQERRAKFGDGKRVPVAQQQRGLIEDQAGCPNRRRTAEPRENALGSERLNREKQECGKENGDGGDEPSRKGEFQRRTTFQL